MGQHTQGRVASQLRRTRRQLWESPDLCLGRLLPPEQVEQAIARQEVEYRERLYTPQVTLWTFLYQVLSPDPSCQAAVARLLAYLGATSATSASAATGAYCKARARLPEALCADLARDCGGRLQARFPTTHLLGGRPIKIADGTTLSMPDTPANQQAYPQQPAQKPGLGHPILRLVAVLSLSSGTVLDVACGPYSGKRTGETALLRQLAAQFQAGDVLLADALFCNYWTFAGQLARGVDVVAHHDGKRRLDWRAGRRLGPKDHVISWPKPPKPYWMSRRDYQRLPATLQVREVAVEVHQAGFRTQELVVVTTLRDPQAYRREDLAAAYRARWHAELDLRSLKQVLAMEVLRCKCPALVRKEIWMHLLAYNLIRTVLADAAVAAAVRPRELSFKNALQTLNAFAAVWPLITDQATLYATLLKALATHRVGDRPDRVEPRAVKRRPKEQTFLTEPRQLARNRLLGKS